MKIVRILLLLVFTGLTFSFMASAKQVKIANPEGKLIWADYPGDKCVSDCRRYRNGPDQVDKECYVYLDSPCIENTTKSMAQGSSRASMNADLACQALGHKKHNSYTLAKQEIYEDSTFTLTNTVVLATKGGFESFRGWPEDDADPALEMNRITFLEGNHPIPYFIFKSLTCSE